MNESEISNEQLVKSLEKLTNVFELAEKHNSRRCKKCKSHIHEEHGINTDIKTLKEHYLKHIGCRECFQNIMAFQVHYYREINPKPLADVLNDHKHQQLMDKIASEVGMK